jgi:nucleoside-diphosphate kinase
LVRTLVLIKPEAIKRKLIGRIITRFEERGIMVVSMKMLKMNKTLAAKHYEEHKGRDYYEPLLEYMMSGPVIAMVLEANDVIGIVRKMAGSTDPAQADPGTIRGDFGLIKPCNIIHASDSNKSAKREIELFFPK